MKLPIAYTFGNHMHWVDMEWLWGYHVLPGSVRDMIRLCREAGVKGCVNFDGIGYEKLAAEDPEALAELRAAVQEGLVEPVGCSYGQPYGLFQGGESNVRQLIYGARTCRRLLGVWPKTFWEEEFYFFPQLPQMLASCGFTGASLYFQWTWHTPEVPVEESPVIWWEGLDGTRLLAATRNRLNMHQWPEDMDAVLNELASASSPKVFSGESPELIQQWLELMPSPDWMCRSELILPKLKELLADERFDVTPVTLGEYLRSVASGSDVSSELGRVDNGGSDVSSELERAALSGSDVPSELEGTALSGSDVPSELGRSEGSGSDVSSALGDPMQGRHPWGPAAEDIGVEKREGSFLPHWRREGAIYAVTFRLDDSLPPSALAEYAFERDRLNASFVAGRLTREQLDDAYDELHREKMDAFLDAGHGSCILREPRIGQLVHDALRHFDGSRYDLLASAVMPNHVHVVVWPRVGHSLESILKSWKSYTSHEIGRVHGRPGTVWQAEYYDRLVRGQVELLRQVRYVEENPARAGFGNWPWVWGNHDLVEGLLQGDFEGHAQGTGADSLGRDVQATGLGELGRDVQATELQATGLGELGRDVQATKFQATRSIPVRRYTMDQVWHGLTLGKNGDDMRHRSGKAEREIRLAEVLSSIAGVFGRPYPQWDVYPVWELEEAWRELLMAQHHDNDECEGLCGRVGKRQYERAEGMAGDIADAALKHVQDGESAPIFTINPHGWRVHGRDGNRTVKPFSFSKMAWHPGGLGLSLRIDEDQRLLLNGERDGLIRAAYDLRQAALIELSRTGGPNLAGPDRPIGRLYVGMDPVPMAFESVYDEDGQYVLAYYRRSEEDTSNDSVTIQVDRASPHHGVDVSFNWNEDLGWLLEHVTPGFKGALTFAVPLPWPDAEIYADTPYAVCEVGAGSTGVRKYPEGDWMTSPQWFESVEGAFTSNSMVDIVDPASGEGLLIAHKGSQQWFKRDGALYCVLAAEDPWDADFFRQNAYDYSGEGNRWSAGASFRLCPHGPIDHAERWKTGQEFQQKWLPLSAFEFAFADIEPGNVAVTALYRETEDFAGKHVGNYAGTGMGYPYVLRLVELNGEDADVELTIVGPVAKAYKTNLLGQIESELTPSPQPPPPPRSSKGEGELGFQYDVLRFPMRPHEIATLYLDIVPGRKQTRDLDAKREIWATVHRRDD